MLMSTTRRCGNSTCSEHAVICYLMMSRKSFSPDFHCPDILQSTGDAEMVWDECRENCPSLLAAFWEAARRKQAKTVQHTDIPPLRFGLIQRTQGLHGRKVWESYIRTQLSCKTSMAAWGRKSLRESRPIQGRGRSSLLTRLPSLISKCLLAPTWTCWIGSTFWYSSWSLEPWPR